MPLEALTQLAINLPWTDTAIGNGFWLGVLVVGVIAILAWPSKRKP